MDGASFTHEEHAVAAELRVRRGHRFQADGMRPGTMVSHSFTWPGPEGSHSP